MTHDNIDIVVVGEKRDPVAVGTSVVLTKSVHTSTSCSLTYTL